MVIKGKVIVKPFVFFCSVFFIFRGIFMSSSLYSSIRDDAA